MSDYADLKRMIEDLVVERNEWKSRSERGDKEFKATRERDDFNRCEAHFRGRKISKLQAEKQSLLGVLDALENMLAAQYDGDPRRQASCDLCMAAMNAITRARGDV